jgi:L-alanine-DL-glutamate epimerase-like enolase superfamily enzyme
MPVASDTSTLRCVNGMLKVPAGPGLGVTIDPAFVAKGEVLR